MSNSGEQAVPTQTVFTLFRAVHIPDPGCHVQLPCGRDVLDGQPRRVEDGNALKLVLRLAADVPPISDPISSRLKRLSQTMTELTAGRALFPIVEDDCVLFQIV